MTYLIIDNDTNEVQSLSALITTQEEAVEVLEMLNSGMAEAGYEPCFRLESDENVTYLGNYR